MPSPPPCGTVAKTLPASAGFARDAVSIPGSRRSSGEGNGNPLQYSCLGTPMDRGAWQATVHGVARVGHNLVTKPPSPHTMLNIYYISDTMPNAFT